MDNNDRMPVIADVARLVGVSSQTVSRVLNRSPQVSPETRAKVLAAVQTLGYRRNAAARALVTRRSGTVGVLVPGGGHHGPVRTLYALEHAARAAGLGVVVAVVDEPEPLVRALERLHEQAVEGVIALAPLRSIADVLAARRHALPTIVVGGTDEGGPHGGGDGGGMAAGRSVAIDQAGGAAAVTDHLLGLGHRTVHHIAGPAGWLDAAGRREGWAARLEVAGIPPPATVAGDWTARSGYAAMRTLLAAGPAPTAVFVANDQMALGALRALRDADLLAPHDVSVVGFDDVPEAAYFVPPLTTVRQDFTEIGRRAVRMLLGLIRSPAEPVDDLLRAVPCQLVVRGSTGPCR